MRIRTGVALAMLMLAGRSAGAEQHLAAGKPLPADAKRTDVVVLVHGLGRTELSMLPLEWTLEAAGYRVLNWGYSSICCHVRELARELAADVREVLQDPEVSRIHFVGHSLGNIIIRAMVDEARPEKIGRIVMLAPPNRGSEVADLVEPALGWLLKPLSDLTTNPTSTAQTVMLPPAIDVGVIAGEHDGKVRIPETYLPGQDAHVVVPSAHTFIMLREDVQRFVLDFLEHGQFQTETTN